MADTRRSETHALSDEVLGAALDAMPMGVIVVDHDRVPRWSNRAARDLVPSGAGRLEEAVALSHAVGRAIVEGGVAVGRTTLPTDHGLFEREIWAAPLDAGGEHLIVAVFPADADLRLAGSADRELRQRLEVMLEHSADIITVLDRNGVVRFSNAAAGRLTGFAGGEVNGRAAFDLIHPEDVEPAVAAFADAVERPGEIVAAELRVRFADGAWHNVEASLKNLLGVPSVDGIVVTLHDVTERKRAEAERERSAAQLRSLVENITDTVVVLDANLSVTYTTPSIASIIDASVESNVGQSAFNDIHPDDLPFAAQTLSDLMASPVGSTVRIELRLERRPRSGDWRWIEATAVNRLGDPAVEGIVCTLRDVTEQKRAAEDLQAAFERERATAERLRELDRLKDDFLATVSHELRTPLASILGFAELLGRNVLDDITKADLLTRVSASAAEMRSMVDNLLDFSALEAGKVVLDRVPINVADVVDTCLRATTQQLAHHTVTAEVEPGLVALGDVQGLGHVVRNLLTNAAKYAEPGTEVTLRATRAGDEVVIEVQDQGRGIAPDVQQHIFERFYRAPDAVFAGRGSGVGLNIVKRYIEMMGGTVTVDSEVGKGSTFTVRVPSAPASA